MKYMKIIKRCLFILPALFVVYIYLYEDIPQILLSKTPITFLLEPFNSSRHINIKTNQKAPSVMSGNVWIVLVIKNKPTKQQLHLCQVRQWTILIVGNDEHGHHWRKAGCVYHSSADQQKLGYNSAHFSSSFSSVASRKNTAILFAIDHGADIIYDVEDTDNILNLPGTWKWCLEYSNSAIINPFKHFSQNNTTQSLIPYTISDCLHSVVSVMPYTDYLPQSVDASQNQDSTRKKLRFNKYAPPFTTAPFVFINFIPKTKMYTKASIWTAALLPDTLVEDSLIHSYFQQRLVWELHGRHVVYPSNQQFYTRRNVDVTGKVERALYVLRNWTCACDKSVLSCLEDLTLQMVRFKIWSGLKYKIIMSWIQDLKMMNYTLPSLLRSWLDYRIDKTTRKRDARVNYSPSTKSNYFTELHYLYKEMCPFYNNNITMQRQRPEKIESVLLLIVFNHPLYDRVKVLHQLYSVKFDNIAYCGDNITAFIEKTKHLKYTLTFFEESVNKGFQIYKCVTTAMKIYSNTAGILMLGDDVLLNTWTLDQFPQDKAWIHQLVTLIKGQRHSWYNWRQRWGEPAFNKAWDDIISEQLESAPANVNTHFIQIEERLSALTNESDGLCYGTTDIFYMPQRTFVDFIYYANKFAKHKLFLEIAIAVLVVGLNNKEDIVMLSGKYLWAEEKDNYKQFYSVKNTFIHPFKFSIELNTSSGKKFLCDRYLPHM